MEMEPTVVSGPLGHIQWESDQPFPVGFRTLDSDNDGVLCQNKGDQTGLDFRNKSQLNEDETVFQELDNLINISDLSCGDLRFKEDSRASRCSVHIEGFSYTEKTEGAGENVDCTLSWLFSSNVADVVGDNSAYEELSITQEASRETENTYSTENELIGVSVPISTSTVSEGNSKITTQDQILLADLFSNNPFCLPLESAGELDSPGVSEELVHLSQDKQADLPPHPDRETLSPEKGDKGLFPDQVTDLPVTCSSTLPGLPENCLPHDHVSTPLERFDGSVPLLDLEIPDYDSGPSLCSASPASVIGTGAPLRLSPEQSEVDHVGAAVIRNLTSEQQGEHDSVVAALPAESSSRMVPLVKDAIIQGEFITDSDSVEQDPEDLIKDEFCSAVRDYRNEAMALDLCPTAEARDEESWNLKPREDVQNESVPDQTIKREDDRLADANQVKEPECHDMASFDFSLQELSTSEAVWTSEQTETISCSKMVVDDSLPLVSSVNRREEDVSPLKAVFDALDQDGDGFVRIEEFMEFAAAYGADQVRCIAFPSLVVLSGTTYCTVPYAE